eukprot:TRINITY_DN506_c1_g1_i2.p1 TRINITY_DN506_c1_g1~~TRINITY_DN506_c1_g1_i2.p1  ORF type:complete len:226 (-),score=111.43 TRINITY_DN506_c1_g1_i2:144-821(-)
MGNANKKNRPSNDNIRRSRGVEVQQEDVARFANETNIENVEASKLYDAFRKIAANGRVDRFGFLQGLGYLEEAGLKNIKDTPFGERLFQMLDVNGDGSLDLQEFVGGLSLLCKGSMEEKLAISFKIYDLDGNGYITHSELVQMFKSVWISGLRALAVTSGFSSEIEGIEGVSDQIAEMFAKDAFEKIDTDGDGKLSEEEFKLFALSDPTITASLNGFSKELKIVL